MEASSGTDLCRITVVAPRTRMDLALPVGSPLADLLPTLLRYAGEDPDDPTFLRGGWILQRLGENALDQAQPLSGLGIRDGEVLHLRHRETAIPEFAFDDVADAITTATRSRRTVWKPSDTRTASVVLCVLFLALGAVVALVSGPPWPVPTAVVLVTACCLLAGGAALSRAFGESRIGVVLGAGAVTYGGIGGLLLLGGDDGITSFGAAHLLVGLTIALVVTTLAAIGVVAGWDGFLGAGAVALIGALACAGRLLADSGSGSGAAAAVAVAVVLGLTPYLPTFAARLAKLPVPQLPTSAEDLRSQADTLPGPTVLRQAITADRLVVALLAAVCVVCAAGGVVLVRSGSWFGTGLTGVVGLALILRARHFLGRTQRLWLLSSGSACIVWVVLQLALTDLAGTAGPADRAGSAGTVLAVAGIPCILTAAALGAWATRMPGRRLSPYWGRACDLFEVAVLLGIVPLTLGAVGVYRAILGLFG